MLTRSSTAQPNTINNIKDMIAGLPEFREGKDLYALHLNMAQECMDIFQRCKLPEVATVEQVRVVSYLTLNRYV